MIDLLSPRLIARWCQVEYGFKNLTREEMTKRVISRAENILHTQISETFQIYHSSLDLPLLKQSNFFGLTIYFPNQKQAVIIFRGTETINDWYYNYTGVSAGANVDKIKDALNYCETMKKMLPQDTAYIGAGHSLGGHLVNTVQLLTCQFMRVYTFNTATVQLYQLRQLDSRFNQQLQSYYYNNPKIKGTIEKFATHYYQQPAQAIINYKRENDFIHYFYETPGAFLPGKTIDLPPLLSQIVNPYDYMSTLDIQTLLLTLSEFYQYLLTKGITTNNIHLSTKQLTTHSQYFLFEKLIKPLQITHWFKQKQKWIRLGGTPPYSPKQSTPQDAYHIFKAIYHYLTFLVHTGLIPETIIEQIPQQEIINKFKQNMSIDQLLQPLLRFINVLKALWSYIEYKNGKNIDLSGWKHLAKLHYLDYLYEVLPLSEK